MRRLGVALAAVLLVALALPAAAPAKKRTLHASLSAAAEVPAAAPGGSAKAKITLDAARRRVCWSFTQLKGVSGPNAAHIHQGEAGKAGAIVVPFGAAFRSSGCQARVAKTTINQILAHPGRYYVNIHNSQFPAGAVRGQLRR